MILYRNDSMYFICSLFGKYYNFIYDVMLTLVILRELHHLWFDLTPFIFIFIIDIFCQAPICTHDYFLPSIFLQREIVFPWYLAWTIDEVEPPWCISSNG